MAAKRRKRARYTNWKARAAEVERENVELAREIGQLRGVAAAVRAIAEAIAPLLREEIDSAIDEKLDELTISH